PCRQAPAVTRNATSTPNQPGATARMNAPSVVTQRRPENRIIVSPMTLGMPTTDAIAMSGRTLAWITTVYATHASAPTALPISMAPASDQERGRGITSPTVLRLPVRRAGLDARVGQHRTSCRGAFTTLVIGAGDDRRGNQGRPFFRGEEAAAG